MKTRKSRRDNARCCRTPSSRGSTNWWWQWTWWNLTTCSGLHAMFPTWYCASYAIDASDAAADSDSCEVLAVSTCGCPSMEPNESRNPPSAAYAAQEVPAKNPGGIEVVDDPGNRRTVSPTARTQEQVKSLNAAYVPKGWMLLPSGALHRLYA